MEIKSLFLVRFLTESEGVEGKLFRRVRPAPFRLGHRQPAESLRSRKLIDGVLKGKNDNELIPKPLTF